MTKAELIELASPPCHTCEQPVQRVEQRWHRDENNDWRPGPWAMVCEHGHRVRVEPFGARC